MNEPLEFLAGWGEPNEFSSSVTHSGVRSVDGETRVADAERREPRGELIELGDAANRAETYAIQVRMAIERRGEEGAAEACRL